MKSNAIRMSAAGCRGIHPAVMLCSWLLLLMALHFIAAYKLVLLAGLFMVFALVTSRERWMALLRRSRWLLLSIVLIYAYAGSGELLWPQLGSISPYKEGLAAGGMQLLHLLVILSSLAILLQRLGLAGVMQALEVMLRPLASLGINVERGLVRLALTLDFIEQEKSASSAGWRALLSADWQQGNGQERHIQLSRIPFALVDGLFSGLILILIGWMLW